jgi:hypothetical protein
MMRNRVYICGGVTGVSDFSDRFSTAESELIALGYEAVNPITLGIELARTLDREPTYEEYMTADLAALATCHNIRLLEGWENSKGARREWERAKELGIDPIYLDGDY